MKYDWNVLSKEELVDLIGKMHTLLTEEQRQALQEQIRVYQTAGKKTNSADDLSVPSVGMSSAFAAEKMQQMKAWMQQIDEGSLRLDAEEYQDYSGGYWDDDWGVEYHDSQGIGEKLTMLIQFARDCVDDGRYQEACVLYDWLWEMAVSVESDYDEADSVDLEILKDQDLIHADLKQLALLTLYTAYQVTEPEERAERIYSYFSYSAFRELHMEDMFFIGKDPVNDTEQFLKDWIQILKAKSGDMEARLLKEAVLYQGGIEELIETAEETAAVHPSLYLAAMAEYEKLGLYENMEILGRQALEKIDRNLVIRAAIARKGAWASDCLQHEEDMMQFCWESFCSHTTETSYLRLFGTEQMAKRYGQRENLNWLSGMKEAPDSYCREEELRRNGISRGTFYTLRFFHGDFDTVKQASKNPANSLGWSSSFIRIGIRLILLYLYDNPVPSRAAQRVADYVDGYLYDSGKAEQKLTFEKRIQEESQQNGVSEFWQWFQNWKRYVPVEETMRKTYLSWAEKIVCKRADAIVSGQHRGHYAEVAALLALVAEIKEQTGIDGARLAIFSDYKHKFPRHSSFQKEMKSYFSLR